MENEKAKPRMQRYEVLINDLTTNTRVKYGARVAVERELLQEAADALKCLTGPDTGYATGYQIGYACGKADGEREAAEDINVPTDRVSANARQAARGRWETADDPECMVQTFSCSNCGYDLDEFYVEYAYPGRTGYYYCPNCGADMREVETGGI